MVLTDIRMSGSLDGRELARRVRANWPHLKIVVISSEPRSALADAPADAFLGKPYHASALIDRVNKLLGKPNDGP